jgi:hypothetical protein
VTGDVERGVLKMKQPGENLRVVLYEIVVRDRLQIVVQFIDQRHGRRNVEFNDLRFRDVVQVFYECAQAVAVCRNEDAFARADRRRNGLVPVRQETGHGVL